MDPDLLFEFYALGIAAPFALQGAPFEKYLSTDSRAVMDGKVLDIEYDAV
jgi:hypothetical protein